MTKVLILVHGMGVHGTDWSSDAISVLTTAAESYGLANAFVTDVTENRVAVVPISYDDRFTAWLKKWGNDSRALAKFIKTNAIDVPANIMSWLETADQTENNFLWSHVVDVLLYRFFNDVTKDVRVHVMKSVAETWKEALEIDKSARVSVLAHSLGTSVVHDSLGLLATNPPKGATGFLAGDRRLANLFMVANVSRILETLPRVYESVICPPSSQSSKAYCGVFYNARHELDPFPAPRAFKPVWTPGGDYVEIRTKAVREFNVHSLERYLEDPRVHVPVLRALFGHGAIDDAIATQRIEAYDAQPGPPCVQALHDFVTASRERVRLIEDSTDIKTLFTAGTHFLADVERAKAKCKST
jgi:hypothetical protein